MKLCVFGYNFPHRKTQDFLFHLTAIGFKPDLVILAPKVTLKNRQQTHSTKESHALLEPSIICQNLGIKYAIMPHNEIKTTELIVENNCDIALIAGARILKANIISCFNKGIINFHPGKLPEIRGLDAPLWSIINNEPFCVTAHFIDYKIDQGRLIKISALKCGIEDNLASIYEQLYQLQLKMLDEVIDIAQHVNIHALPVITGGKLNTRMTALEEKDALEKLGAFLRENYSELEAGATY